MFSKIARNEKNSPGSLFSFLVILLSAVSCATDACKDNMKTGQLPRSFQGRKYWLHLPESYPESDKHYPLMIFLHGAGERGKNLRIVKRHGPPKLVEKGKEFPFIIVSPQCPERQWWKVAELEALLEWVLSRNRVDEDRIYLTGLSMGGFGTWEWAIESPHRFAAVAPICGGGDPAEVHVIKHLPVWAFHGAKDPLVPLEESEEMVDALKACGGNVKFTVYPEAGHDSWSKAYEDPELYEWFLSHKRKNK